MKNRPTIIENRPMIILYPYLHTDVEESALELVLESADNSSESADSNANSMCGYGPYIRAHGLQHIYIFIWICKYLYIYDKSLLQLK